MLMDLKDLACISKSRLSPDLPHFGRIKAAIIFAPEIMMLHNSAVPALCVKCHLVLIH